jgi:hypothetical protein
MKMVEKKRKERKVELQQWKTIGNCRSFSSYSTTINKNKIMQSTSADLLYDVRSFPSVDEDDTSISSFSSTSTAVTTSSYTSKQLQRLLIKEKQKFRILKNESTKIIASWWRSFGYPAVLNEQDQFERIPGFISCLKCCHTSGYSVNSGTKRFISHADRCFPLVSSCPSADDKNDSQSTQLTLNNIGFKRKLKLTEKEQKDIKELYAKWVCEDLRPYSIVEDKGFQQIAQMFIRMGKNITAALDRFHVNFNLFRCPSWLGRCKGFTTKSSDSCSNS